MFSSIVAHLTDIIPSLASLFAPASAVNSDSDQPVRALTDTTPAAMAEGQDRRQLFVGRWDCAGKKVVDGKELPYNGHMHNFWTMDKTWLVIEFKESQPAEGKAFSEDQYWGFAPETGISTRPMMTSVNGFALVTSPGWVDNTMVWHGTYTVGGTILDLTETIMVFDHNKMRMYGEMFLKGQSVGLYDVMCTRKHHGNGHHLDGTPTV